MFDQDNLDNLGRAHQLNAQEKTRQAILDLQEKEARMPKCPWCAGPVENNVSKCRHCTSDIEWVGGEQCKPEDKSKVMLKQRQEKNRQERLEEGERLRENQLVRCKKCKEGIKRRNAKITNNKGRARILCKSCDQKDTDSRKKKCLVIFVVVFGLSWWRMAANIGDGAWGPALVPATIIYFVARLVYSKR